jgi:hypothetical protein
MPNATLTVSLPPEEAAFLEAYAKERGVTAADLVSRYVQRLRTVAGRGIHPEVRALSGIIPAQVDVEAEYRHHLLEKHR